MEQLQSISNLSKLLLSLKELQNPVFVSLCARCGSNNQLLDNVLNNIQESYGYKLGYEKLTGNAAQLIKDELQVSKNPVLLLISKGEIKAIFGGITAQYRLERALQDLGLAA